MIPINCRQKPFIQLIRISLNYLFNKKGMTLDIQLKFARVYVPSTYDIKLYFQVQYSDTKIDEN